MEELFTHVALCGEESPGGSVYSSEEESDPIDMSGGASSTSTAINMTFAALLETGCQKLYGKSPIFKDCQASSPERHAVKCVFGGSEGVGESTTKKSAKHLASKLVLQQIIKAEPVERWKEFRVQGSNVAEAESWLQDLMPELEPTNNPPTNGVRPTETPVDWIGKCNQLCQTRKLSTQPQYQPTEEGPPNNRRFICSAQLFELRAEGEKCKTKKEAKNSAARALFEAMQSTPSTAVENAGEPNNVSGVENLASHPEDSSSPSGSVAGEENIGATLKEWIRKGETTGSEKFLRRVLAAKNENPAIVKLLSDSPEILFNEIMPLSTGQCQIYLELNNPAGGRYHNTFGGEGENEQAARDDASLQALRFLHHCGNWSQ